MLTKRDDMMKRDKMMKRDEMMRRVDMIRRDGIVLDYKSRVTRGRVPYGLRSEYAL